MKQLLEKVEQNIVICQYLADQFIIDLLATGKSQYFDQPCSIIVNYYYYYYYYYYCCCCYCSQLPLLQTLQGP